MPLLPRPRPTDRDDDGWVDAWIGLRQRLRAARSAIEAAAAGPRGRGPTHADFVHALLGLVRLSRAVDAQVDRHAADARLPAPLPAAPEQDLLR